jgi:acyl-CoA synthetase (AMP-forming)/AMP-acid ligase II
MFGGLAPWPRERVALAFEDQEFTHGRLDELASGYAAALAARGVKPGTRVALMGSNRPEWVAAVLGIWRAGRCPGRGRGPRERVFAVREWRAVVRSR